MSELEVFGNEEFELSVEEHSVDGFRVRGAGLAKALGFRDAVVMTRTVPAGERGYILESRPGGEPQQVIYVTEAGFYRILGQRQVARIKDEAVRGMVERFQTWVYAVVLPGLRRGTLIPQQRQPEVDIPRTLPAALRAYANEVEAHEETRVGKEIAEAKVAELEPAALAWANMVEPVDGWDVKGAAQAISSIGVPLGEGRLFRLLLTERWAYRDGSKRLRPMQSQIDNGRLTTKLQTRPLRDEHGNIIGTQSATPQIRLTKKGLELVIALITTQKLKEIGA